VITVGLTGGIGAGKSTVAQRLAELGAVVIDADALAREVVQPGTPGLAAVVDAFGAQMLTPDATLDRAALAAHVFSDPDELARLNAIVHPLVAQRTATLVAAAPTDAVVVHDIPLLVETGGAGYDLVVVVDAPDDVRLDRLVQRGLPADEARRRMAAQASREERLTAADVVLDNAGERGDLIEQVDELWRELVERLR
jgi:dephospho-CoA kinase